ncbi:MAG: YeeE/YedE family protein [Moraxellaceae bacterium]|nr:MAG: YeeE/YedE family protein [Moraxellaceae bacterium]
MKLSQIIVSLVSGMLFGIGLALSGMMDPKIVTAFLNPFGDWNYSLAFVMASAISVTAPAFYFIFKKNKPILDDSFYVSDLKNIDKKLLIGGALFGIGWGIYGLCPGPAIAQLFSYQPEIIIFVFAMMGGMLATEKLSR